MPTYLAAAVGVTPVTWTVCGLWLLARKASPAVAGSTATPSARAGAEAAVDARGPVLAVPLTA